MYMKKGNVGKGEGQEPNRHRHQRRRREVEVGGTAKPGEGWKERAAGSRNAGSKNAPARVAATASAKSGGAPAAAAPLEGGAPPKIITFLRFPLRSYFLRKQEKMRRIRNS